MVHKKAINAMKSTTLKSAVITLKVNLVFFWSPSSCVFSKIFRLNTVENPKMAAASKNATPILPYLDAIIFIIGFVW